MYRCAQIFVAAVMVVAGCALSVDHFAAVLIFDKNGSLATLDPSGVSPGDMATDMRFLAGSTPSVRVSAPVRTALPSPSAQSRTGAEECRNRPS